MNVTGKRIMDLREEKGLTQVELAAKIDVGVSTISRYEAGDRMPTLDIAKRMADYFEVSIDYIAGMTEIREVLDLSALGTIWDQMEPENKVFLIKTARHLLNSQKGTK